MMSTEQQILSELLRNIHMAEERKDQILHRRLKEVLKEDPALHRISNISFTECHVLECISQADDIYSADISKKTGLTRGGISKIMTRLEKKGLIETFQKEGDRKKIFFRLTPLGEKIHQTHMLSHKEISDHVTTVIRKFTADQQDIILAFLKEI